MAPRFKVDDHVSWNSEAGLGEPLNARERKQQVQQQLDL